MMTRKLMLGGNVFGHFCGHKESEEIIRLAHQNGVRAIDTANVYSGGLSEAIIGDVLLGERKNWFVATKVGVESHVSPVGIGARDHILRSIEKSLDRLKTDYIDLYQMHHFDPDTPLEETVLVLNKLKADGTIREFGFSNFNSCQLKTLKYVMGPATIFHQSPFNIVVGETHAVIEPMKILAYSVFHRGLLSSRYLTGKIPENSRAARSSSVQSDLSKLFLIRLREMDQVCKKNGLSISAVALNWVLRFDHLAWAIVGCHTTDQLNEAIRTTRNNISENVLKECEVIWKNKHEMWKP